MKAATMPPPLPLQEVLEGCVIRHLNTQCLIFALDFDRLTPAQYGHFEAILKAKSLPHLTTLALSLLVIPAREAGAAINAAAEKIAEESVALYLATTIAG